MPAVGEVTSQLAPVLRPVVHDVSDDRPPWVRPVVTYGMFIRSHGRGCGSGACSGDPLRAGGVIRVESTENGNTFDLHERGWTIFSLCCTQKQASASSSNTQVLKKTEGPRFVDGKMRGMFTAVKAGSARLELKYRDCQTGCIVYAFVVVSPISST